MQALEAAIERQASSVLGAAGPQIVPEPEKFLEKVILSADFLDIRYLENGVAAARAVCRVVIREQGGRVAGYGSGSLISSRLVLTNHHVLESAETAQFSALEFNFQDGPDGRPRQTETFDLDPEQFFVADEERDFALCAVRATEDELKPYGFNPLIGAEGKAIVGEFVTIVQHPQGRKKQISLRENRIVDLPDDFIHYEADTEPGSSGSPVFNDQWEIVALHHASVPTPEQNELGGFLNEGIRASRILRFLDEAELSAGQRHLLEGLPKERINAPVGSEPSVSTSGPSTASKQALLLPQNQRMVRSRCRWRFLCVLVPGCPRSAVSRVRSNAMRQSRSTPTTPRGVAMTQRFSVVIPACLCRSSGRR